MEIYSEYYGTGRKATVTKLARGVLDRQFDVWEVALYIENKVIQRTTIRTEGEAEDFAESWCQGSDGNQVLLNEVING
jgi:methionine aminopeptidase